MENDFDLLKQKLSKLYYQCHKDLVFPVFLDDKVEDFLRWYSSNVVRDNVCSFKRSKQIAKVNEMRNLIEKMAIWYENRYSDDDIIRMIKNDNDDTRKNEFLKEKNNISHSSCNLRYFFNMFLNSLSPSEKKMFDDPVYDGVIYLDTSKSNAHLHLNYDGFVEYSENVGIYTNFEVKDEELSGMHVKDVFRLFKERKIPLYYNNELIPLINRVKIKTYQKNEMLNCVMYRLIERNPKNFGPYRAFLFAKEFERDIDIPMMYGVNFLNYSLTESLIHNYLKSSGSKDLICYKNYFLFKDSFVSFLFTKVKTERIHIISVNDLAKFLDDFLSSCDNSKDDYEVEKGKKLLLRKNGTDMFSS